MRISFDKLYAEIDTRYEVFSIRLPESVKIHQSGNLELILVPVRGEADALLCSSLTQACRNGVGHPGAKFVDPVEYIGKPNAVRVECADCGTCFEQWSVD